MKYDFDPKPNKTDTLADDRRIGDRRDPAETRLLLAKISGGPEVDLLNVSQGGALIESQSELAPGSKIKLRLVTEDGFIEISGSILRSKVLSGGKYQFAVAFDYELAPFLVTRMQRAIEKLLSPYSALGKYLEPF